MPADYKLMIYDFLTPQRYPPPVKGIYQGGFANFGGVENEVSVQNIIDFEKDDWKENRLGNVLSDSKD